MRFVLIPGGFHGAGVLESDDPGTRKTRPRSDAVLEVLRSGDVLVGHSGGVLEITRAADAAPELVSHVVYLAAALPLEGRLMQDALVYRDDGGVEGDYDVTGMLEHLNFGADGSMAFADAEGAKELFYNDCDDESVR